MTVYTGRGDDGDTDLFGGDRVSKTHPRIESYGTVDELNALLGIVRPTHHDDVDEILGSIQNHLHVMQAELANPTRDEGPQITTAHIDRIESWIDDVDKEIEPLESFILPGGNRPGAALHHARTVCRRAERRVVALAESDAVSNTVTSYLNRLSDLLFVLARVVNNRDGVEEREPTY